MGQIAIAATGLSKRYRIPPQKVDHEVRNWSFASIVPDPFIRRRNPPERWIDAVHDIDFTIEAGEAVGLIGRNGAGKSTLLKLLSRVTRPSAGHADVYGRVGALLEVGTGFHPELTGRENTFLSGAILGMSTREIGARFDEIVAFSEIEPFIDMPVKHYSSGMYARLGFSVAAFLKPAILIVDEILAVGDLSFQAKCIAHMRRLPKDGTTVLFVSHNLLSISDFCPRSIVLSDGLLTYDGPTSEAITLYRRSLPTATSALEPNSSTPVHEVRANGLRVGDVIECLPNDKLEIELDVERPVDALATDIELNLVVETSDGRLAIHLRSDIALAALRLMPGRNILTVTIEELPLVPNNYSLWLRVVDLGSTTPVIWDTRRIHLLVNGDQRLESVAQPRHEFGQRPPLLVAAEHEAQHGGVQPTRVIGPLG